ncbi:HesA/MoeB/ThiF family protein [Paracoccus aminophilus]|uniref:Molybdopterin-synthase adenylyltransferase n=1 Tax=Paracoccus aminophilus JCM 7686 TaxID=1367847 RepID=S5XX79_PARAH|nr:HesA/MoeB/ThiF family protein [Paracoccus aminophilus]AGT09927.1 molybdopterin biosynthesis protein [Paracoccus aminophilus JCM 7686]
MLVLFLFLAIWAAGRFFGLRALYLWLAALGLWLGVIAVQLLQPDSRLAHAIGGGPEAWVMGGVIVALVLAYRRLVGLAHRAAVPVVTGGTSPHPESAPNATPRPQALLADDELDRYARHMVLREIGGPGQAKLRRANVLIVGAGALGSPVALYLAAAGFGRITLADADHVSISNLQRQILFRSSDAGAPKVEAGRAALAALNPHVEVTSLPRFVTAEDAPLIGGFDLVLDGTDTFAARQAINAACVAAGVPLVSGTIAQWEGQLTVWDPARGAPCMACLFPEAPADGLAPSCAEAGVVGALPGVIGSMMALEAIKAITGAGAVSRGRMTIFDGLWGETRTITIRRREGCPVCGGVHL